MIHLEVWYDDYYDAWAVTTHDEEGNIVDDTTYSKYKKTAIESAKAFKDPKVAIKIFGKNGELQKIIF